MQVELSKLICLLIYNNKIEKNLHKIVDLSKLTKVGYIFILNSNYDLLWIDRYRLDSNLTFMFIK